MKSLRLALSSLRRAPVLAGMSIVSIGLSLLVVGLFGITAHNISLALSRIESRVEVVGYLKDGTSAEQVALARNEISSFPEVAEVMTVSKAEALRRARKELTEFSDVFSDLEVNPLPASIEVRLAKGRRKPSDARAVANRLRTYSFVEEVRFGRAWVEQLYRLRRIAAGTALALGGTFAIGAVLLISIAIRMAVLAKADEIRIMQIVGATRGYIRRPFMIEGVICGAAGGGVALGLTWVTYTLVNHSLLAVEWLPATWVVAGLSASGILGIAAAMRAVGRELRAHNDG